MGMTSSQRLNLALSHQEPDRVPYTLFATMHPAKKFGVSLKEYYSRPDLVVEGQLFLREEYQNDILGCYPFAGVEMIPWGGDVVYFEEGPPNAGKPVIKDPRDILKLKAPSVASSPDLQSVLEAVTLLKSKVGEDIPIAGTVISPFSLPVMQMGFEAYLDLIHAKPDLLQALLDINIEFCVAWANAQLKAGCSAVVYADPVSSPTILPSEISLKYGLPTARKALARINGGVMFHLASGRGLPLVEELSKLGVAGMSASAEEDLSELKRACQGKMALVGNLNAVSMQSWTPEIAEAEVKRAIARAGPGGGFVLSDNHGEIPFAVDHQTLKAVAKAVRRWGRYPLDWVNGNGR
ncbi:uroporphyrinogen decarboxylase family protein [Dethiosulfatarculus sandiegensis]|nr:uroporphyrinogen decarboxylase family protein [Dethiosulfatarculus sandiegensis]